MKTPDQIKEDIKARTAELESLVSQHNSMMKQFHQACAQNQQRANFLQGQIATFESFLEEPKIGTGDTNGDEKPAPMEEAAA